MHQLKLLGGAMLQGAGGTPAGSAGRRHPLALLALLATAPSRTLSRAKVIALLWPEATESQARNRLTSLVYDLRQELDVETLLSLGDDLRLTGSGLRCDVWQFEDAVERGDPAGAVRLYRGPFLDGFHLEGSVALDQRVERERGRLRRRYLDALEQLAGSAEAAGRPAEAVRWWKDRAAEDEYDGRVTQRLMRALEAAGNPAGALEAARAHAALLRSEMGLTPSERVLALARDIQRRCAVTGQTDGLPSRGAREETRADHASSDPDPASRVEDSPAPGVVPSALHLPATIGRRRDRLRRVALGTAVGFALIVAAALTARGIEGLPFGGGADEVDPGEATAEELALQAEKLDTRVFRMASTTSRQRVQLYRRALELDSAAARTWAGLADAFAELSWGRDQPTAWADSGLAAARRAIELDPALPDGYTQLGDALWVLDAPDEQVQAYQRALQLDPTHGEALNNLATLLHFRGEWARAVALHRDALRRSPGGPAMARLAGYQSAFGNDSLADAWLARGRGYGHDLDIAEFEIRLFHRLELDRARELLPRIQNDRPLMNTRRRAALALYERDWPEARRLYRELYPGTPIGHHFYRGLLWDPLGLAYVLSRTGETAEARAIAREVVDRVASAAGGARGMYTVPNRLAVAHLILGDTTTALQWLERSVDRGFLDLRRVRSVPTLDGLWGNAEFQRILLRMDHRLAEERVATEATLEAER